MKLVVLLIMGIACVAAQAEWKQTRNFVGFDVYSTVVTSESLTRSYGLDEQQEVEAISALDQERRKLSLDREVFV